MHQGESYWDLLIFFRRKAPSMIGFIMLLNALWMSSQKLKGNFWYFILMPLKYTDLNLRCQGGLTH
jgi:uncharacterized protein YdaL